MKPENTSPHLNAQRLAAALGRSSGFVFAMKKHGYAFKYGRLTTARHAKLWLKEHPEFRTSSYFRPKQVSVLHPEGAAAV